MSRKKANKTVSDKIIIIIPFIVLVLFLYIWMGRVIINSIQEQNKTNVDKLMALYTDEIDNCFFRLSHWLLLEVMDTDSNIVLLRDSFYKNTEDDDTVYQNYLIGELRDEFCQNIWQFGEEYLFFLYYPESETLVDLNITLQNTQLKKDAQTELMDEILKKGDFTYLIKQKWDSYNDGKKTWIYKVAYYNGTYLCCYVDAESLLQPFFEIGLGEDSTIRLLDEQDNVLFEQYGDNTTAPKKHPILDLIWDNEEFLAKASFSKAPFTVEISSNNSMVSMVLTSVLTLLIILAFVILMTYTGILAYIHLTIMRPLQRYASCLVNYENGSETELKLNTNNFIELKQMDEHFSKLVSQIRGLKITLYEQELENKQIELDYLKMQIRPHFYLNCLNFIYTMIDLGMYDNAQRMSYITTDYLRYIFQSGDEAIPLSEELQHCRNYLEIVMLRYGDELEYEVIEDERGKNTEIFPFLVEVFVENIIKHAITFDKKILITIKTEMQSLNNEDYLLISICDTGNGFEEKVLKQLNNGDNLTNSKGEHIGISNCLKRMKHYYGEKGKIVFKNAVSGGAIVEIYVPVNH